MARVVCQVLVRPDRVTLVWSQGPASFEPYHLTGPEVPELHRLAGQARDALRRLADASGDDTARAGHELAQLGHRLYRQLFRLDQAPAETAEVREWLASLEGSGSVETVEFLGNAPGLVPWTVLCENAADAGAFHGADAPGWRSFWGARHNLGTGRRVNALRQVQWLEKPAVLLVIDPELRDALPEPQQKRLREFVEVNHLPAAESLDQLSAALRTQAPELIYFFCRAGGDGLLLGGAPLDVGELEEVQRGEADGPPWTSRVVFVNACRGAAADWGRTAERLQRLGLGGLILPEQPLPEGPASGFGLDFLAGLLYGREPAGKLLQSLRGRHPRPGLLYSSTCPPDLRVTWAEDDAPEEEIEAEPLPPLPDTPYRPLTPYDTEDRALFVGRDDDTAAVGDLLDAPDTRVVVLHGRGGVGKSSLLRAGVIPYLEDDNVGYRALRDRSEPEEGAEEDDAPVLAVRATFDLPGQLALALAAFCDRPFDYTTPSGRAVTVDLPEVLARLTGRPAGQAAASTAVQPAGQGTTAGGAEPPEDSPDADELRDALCGDPALLARLLAALGERLPFEPVLLIEQGEEVFTLARSREDAENRRLALEMLRRLAASPGAGKVLLSLRTEYYGRLITSLRQDLRRAGGVRDYFLPELDQEAMLAAVVQPTLNEPLPFTDEVPFEKYRFTYEAGLAERIVREARQSARERHESALSLLQVVCARLADLAQGKPDRTATAADLKSIGGVAGGLSRYVEKLVREAGLTSIERKRLRALIQTLYQRQPDGTLTRALVPVQEPAGQWRGAPPVEKVVEAGEAEGVGLLETLWLTTGEEEKPFVSLTHDSLATVAAEWDEAGKLRAHGRTRTVDLLWIFLPLLILVVVYFWSMYVRPYQRAVAELELGKQLRAKHEFLEESTKAERWPVYLGQVARAAEAWQLGDVLGSRQALLTQRHPGDGDLRGFEWYYLWQLAHADRQTLLGTRGPVTGVALTPDGKLLASVGQDGKLRLWDAARGFERASLPVQSGGLNAVALSGDGKLVAVGGDDKTVKVWKIGAESITKEPTATLTGHEGPVLALAFGKGDALASGGADGTVRLWDVAAAKERKALKEHGGAVRAVAFSPDGKLLASGGADQTVVVWDAEGKKQHALGGHGGEVYALAFSPDGKLLAEGGVRKDGLLEGGAVKFWDPAAGKEKGGVTQPAAVVSLAFAADGKTYAAGGKDNVARLRDAATGKELAAVRGHLGWVSGLAFSSDGEALVTGSYDSTIKLWPAAGPAPDVVACGQGPVTAAAVAPGGKLAASAGGDGTVKLWEVATGKEVRTLKGPGGAVQSLALARRGGKLLLAGAVWSEEKEGGRVLVWDADTGSVVHTLKGNGQPLAAVAFSADGKLLAAAGADGTLLVWDAERGEVRDTLKGPSGLVRCVAFAPEGGQLASGGADGKVRVWNLERGQAAPQVLAGHAGDVTALAFAPDGKELVTAGFDRTLRRWDLPSGKTVMMMRGHTAEVLSAAYSPKGEVIVSGGMDGTVRLWDTLRGDQRFTLTGHTGPVRGVAFAPDRRTLVSGGNDGTLRLWRAAAEEEAPPQIGHEQGPAGGGEPEGDGS